MLAAAALMLIAQQPAPATLSEAAPPRREKLICKSRVRTGSRTNVEQACHTAEEWKMIQTEYRRVVEKGQQQRGLR